MRRPSEKSKIEKLYLPILLITMYNNIIAQLNV